MPKLTLPSGDVMLYDECDQWLVDKYNWHITEKGYARSQFKDKTGKIKRLFFHKEIIDCPRGMVRDHINRNKLDNRRKNLRIVTNQQNLWNRKKNKTNPAKYKGVILSTPGYIRARIQHKWLGYFKTQEDAARAYDKEAKKLFGKYANLNFPER